MLVNILEFLKNADIRDVFYPGKRLVKPCRQVGEFKSHCTVLDWRDPAKVRVEVKPGLSGRTPVSSDLKKYPVSFQTPTYVEIEVVKDKDRQDEDEGGEGDGKSSRSGGSGGGQKFVKTGLEGVDLIAARFGDSAEGRIPAAGRVVEMVVMGMHIAKEAFEGVFEVLTAQIAHAKISATELLAHAGELVKRVEPPAFLKPKGDETVQYRYNHERNANIGYIPML